MTFFERITELRKEKGVTQKQVQEELDLGKNSFGDWKNGKTPVRSTQQLLAQYFGVSVDYLLGKTDERKERPVSGSGNRVSEKSGVLAVLAETYHLTHEEYALIEKFVNMEPEARRAVSDYMRDISAIFSSVPAAPGAIASSDADRLIPVDFGNKNTAAARSGDRIEIASVSAEEEEAALPHPSDGSDI